MDKTEVFFLHIGKTGGTAIAEALKDVECEDYILRPCPHRIRLQNVQRGAKIIFFIRNPIDRFISSFYSRQRKGAPRHKLEWSPKEKIAFETFNTTNELAEALSSNDADLKNRAHEAMESIFHVRNSFYDWIHSDQFLETRINDVLYIGNLKRLDEDFEKIKKILGIPDDVKLPTDPVKAHKNTLDVDKHLSSEAIANIENWYQKDMAFYEKWKDGK